MAPQPPLQQRSLGVFPGHRLPTPMRTLLRHTMRREFPLLHRKPAGRLRVVRKQEPDGKGRQDRGCAFQDEEPPPSDQASDEVHVPDSVGDGTSKRAGESSGGEDRCHAEGSFFGAVPECQVVDQSREESCLCALSVRPPTNNVSTYAS